MTLDHSKPLDADARAVKPKKKKRVFLWFFLAVQALFIWMIIAGATSSGGVPDDCGTLSAQACNDAESVGTGIGVFLILVIWFFVNAFLGTIYAVYRLAKRRNND